MTATRHLPCRASPETPSSATDGDGLLDHWKLAHGLDLIDPQDALLDADGDGQSNLAEFLAGTNPTNQFSVFKLVSVEARPLTPPLSPSDGAREIVLRWSSESNQFYAVEQAPNLSAPFTPLATTLRATPPVNGFTNSFPAGTSGFCRLRLQPWPTHLP